jgi:flagellar protein FliO/FliZ
VPIDPDSLSSLSLTIGAIVLLLWIAVWALRRGLRPAAGFGAGDCAVLRSLPLGPRERLLVVRVGGKQLVVGVGTATVSLLCELDEPLPPAAAADDKFATAIGKAMRLWRDV